MNYTPVVIENKSDSLYTFLLDIKEINTELIDRHSDLAVQVHLGSIVAA